MAQGGMGPGMFRDHGDMTDKKVGTTRSLEEVRPQLTARG